MYISGRWFELELKHVVTLFSVIMFFFLVSYCKQEYKEEEMGNLNWLETKVCLNKKSYLSSIALLFLFTIIFDMLKKKLNKSTEKRKEKVKTP